MPNFLGIQDEWYILRPTTVASAVATYEPPGRDPPSPPLLPTAVFAIDFRRALHLRPNIFGSPSFLVHLSFAASLNFTKNAFGVEGLFFLQLHVNMLRALARHFVLPLVWRLLLVSYQV